MKNQKNYCEKNTNTEIIATQSLKDFIEARNECDGGIFLDNDNADFVAKVLGMYLKFLLAGDNKMACVAALVGEKLNKEFQAKYEIFPGEKHIYCLKITRQGLKAKTSYNGWELRNDLLGQLLTGKVTNPTPKGGGLGNRKVL